MSDIEKLKKVCELYYLHDKTRKWIAAELSRDRPLSRPYDETNVNHWLQQARERGVISFDIDPSFAMVGTLNRLVAGELRTSLKLEETIVVDISLDALKDPKAADLHTALANQTGMRLGEITSSRTRFFVAGGRAVVQAARMIKRKGPPASHIRVDPLSGRNWTGSWQVDGPDDLERPLDADDAAIILASAFPQSGTRFSQIGHPLYAESIQQAQTIMRDHCAFLPDGRWNWDMPRRETQRAICGTGVLHPQSGHRIMRFLEAYLQKHGVKGPEEFEKMVQDGTLAKIRLPRKPDRSAPYLSRVALDLIAAITFATERRLGYFGDVANRLYPCLPLPGELREDSLPKRKDYEDLVEKLDALNRRAIVVQWSHLRNASTWVIAGGALKLSPLWTLAIIRHIEQQRPSPPESVMTHLTTDSKTAYNLLNALESFKKASARIKQWYFDLADVLFQQDDRSEILPTLKQR